MAFYFAGAYIAAGLPVDPHFLGSRTQPPDPGSWTSALETVGLLIFVLCFLALGRNWAYRQDAIDKTGAFRANSMALFWGALTRRGNAVCLGCVALFARGNEGRCECCGTDARHGPLANIRHLIVLGAANSGKSALGAALATEAALSEISNDVTKRPNDDRRRARLIKMSTLCWTHDCPRPRSELIYNPTRKFYQAFDSYGQEVSGFVTPSKTPRVSMTPAQFVVLDDCQGTMDDFAVVCDRLSISPTSINQPSGWYRATQWKQASQRCLRQTT